MESSIKTGITQRQVALIAGFGLLIMAIAAIYANFFVFNELFDSKFPGDSYENIKNNESLFRMGISCFLIVLVLDIVVAWALYIFLISVNKSISLLTAWFRLVYTAVAIASLVNLVNILGYDVADLPPSFEPEYLQTKVMQSIHSFYDGWSVAFIFFGIHLILLGILVYQLGKIQKILAVLLILAGLAYLTDNFFKFLIPDYNIELTLYVGFGELIFMIWLLIWGGRKPKSLPEDE